MNIINIAYKWNAMQWASRYQQSRAITMGKRDIVKTRHIQETTYITHTHTRTWFNTHIILWNSKYDFIPDCCWKAYKYINKKKLKKKIVFLIWIQSTDHMWGCKRPQAPHLWSTLYNIYWERQSIYAFVWSAMKLIPTNMWWYWRACMHILMAYLFTTWINQKHIFKKWLGLLTFDFSFLILWASSMTMYRQLNFFITDFSRMHIS